MAEYEPVVYGANAMELTRTGKPSAVYENVTMEQTTAVERQYEPREEIGGSGHDTPAMKKEEVASMIKVDVVVLYVVGVLTLVALGTALGISFAKISKQAMQLEKNEAERNLTFQLIERLQREFQSMETRLNISEETIISVSAACQSLDNNVTENNQKISFVKTRITGIDVSLGAVNSTVTQNQQKLSSLNTSIQTTNIDLQLLNLTVISTSNPDCPSNEYRYNPFSDSCYRVVDLYKNWNGSKDYCTASGEFLATFVTTESVDWLRYMKITDAWGVGDESWWVGGYKSPAGWNWAGRVTAPVNSSVGSFYLPNSDSDDCMYSSSNLFWVFPCHFRFFYFMCETEQISH